VPAPVAAAAAGTPPLAPFRPSAALLAGYLAVALGALAPAVAHAPGLVAAHLALLALAGWGAWRGGDTTAAPGIAARAAVAWLPLVAVPLLYAELPLVAAGLGRGALRGVLHDATVIRWEEALFAAGLGGSPVRALAARWPSPVLSELLHLGYLSYYPLIYGPPAWLWWRARRGGDPQPFAAAVWTVLATFLACYAVFALFPVQGPWHEWPPSPAVPDGAARRVVLAILGAGSSVGTAFPSSHVAVSVAQTLALVQLAPRLAGPAAVATALLAAGAVYGGFHYGVDALAGAALGAVTGIAGPALHARLRARR
jgi:membrane-associated phospholipid phosphatase